MQKPLEKDQIVHVFSSGKRVFTEEVIKVVGYWDEDIELQSNKSSHSFVWNPKHVFAEIDSPAFDILGSVKLVLSKLDDVCIEIDKIINALPTGEERVFVCDANILILDAARQLNNIVIKEKIK